MSQSMIRAANARSSGPSTSSASHAADAVLHALRVLRPSTQRIPPAGSSPVRTNPSTMVARSRCAVAPVVAANRRDASPSHASSSKYRRPARHDGAYPAPRRYRSRRPVNSAIGALTPASAASQAAHSTCTSVQSDAGRSLRRSSRTTRPRRVHRKAVRSSAVHTSDAVGPSPTATLYGASRTSAELAGCASRALGVSVNPEPWPIFPAGPTGTGGSARSKAWGVSSNRSAVAHAQEASCLVCGARLDAEHVEPAGHGFACAFCGALLEDGAGEQIHPLSLVEGPVEHRADIGPTLHEAREELGRTIEEAATETMIRPRYLQALEEDASLDPYPGRIYRRFFLREYAEYLGLDPRPFLDASDAEDDDEPAPLPPINVSRPPRRSWRTAAVVSVATLAVLAGAWARAREASPPTFASPPGASAAAPIRRESPGIDRAARDTSVGDPRPLGVQRPELGGGHRGRRFPGCGPQLPAGRDGPVRRAADDGPHDRQRGRDRS